MYAWQGEPKGPVHKEGPSSKFQNKESAPEPVKVKQISSSSKQVEIGVNSKLAIGAIPAQIKSVLATVSAQPKLLTTITSTSKQVFVL